MRNRPESPANKGCPLVLVFRTKHGRHAVAAAQRFAQVNRPVNGIANAATFILPSFLNASRASRQRSHKSSRLRTLSRMLNRIVPSVFYPSATCSARRNVHDSSSFQKGDIRRDRLRSKVSEDAPRRLGQPFLAPARG